MKSTDLQGKKDSELLKLLAQKQEELREIRFGLSGAAKSTSTVKNLRKDIARINTEMSAKRIADMSTETKTTTKTK